MEDGQLTCRIHTAPPRRTIMKRQARAPTPYILPLWPLSNHLVPYFIPTPSFILINRHLPVVDRNTRPHSRVLVHFELVHLYHGRLRDRDEIRQVEHVPQGQYGGGPGEVPVVGDDG